MSIKEIIFNKNKQNNEELFNQNIVEPKSNNNNNEENVVFNNIENINITEFVTNSQNIIIEEEIAIKNKSILYKDDIVYLKELENQLLSEYPIDKQSLKFIQENVESIAQKIINVKNMGVEQFSKMERGIEYSLINNIINDKFNTNWIFPIIMDKHKIYTKIKEENVTGDNNEDLDIYFSESLENKIGTIEENQRTQMIMLKELYHNRIINRIDYKKMLNTEFNITKPYITKYENGYIKKPKNDTVVLRYNDLRTNHWNTYKISNDYSFSRDVLDDTGKIKNTEETIFINGEDINIVGFLILANTGTNIIGDDVYLPKNYSNLLNKVYNKSGIITKIFNSGDSIIIESPNHGLLDNEIIYIDESNSVPIINNTFSKSVKVINENTIELKINIKLISNGNYGILYKLSKIKCDTYKIDRDDGQLIVNLTDSDYIDKEINNNHNKIYLFNTININKDEYDNIVKMILPNIDSIIKIEKNKLKQSYTFDAINNILNKYSTKLDELNIKNINYIKTIFENNLKKILTAEKPKLINISFNKNSKKYFKKSDYFLSDIFITDKNIEKVYGKYKSFNRPEDNIGLRLKWIESQKDKGELYYLYYLLNTNNILNIKYIENIKNDLQKKFTELDKIYKKEPNSKLYKYQAYIITEEDSYDGFKNLKKTLEDNTIVFYNNNLYIWKGKLVEFKDIDENTLALVGVDLWIWQKEKWNKSDAISKYSNIKSLCELNNIDIASIKLDSLDCIYRKDVGCKSKLQIRLNDNIISLKKSLNDFSELESHIKNKQFIDNINLKIELIIKKFYSSKAIIIEKNDNFNEIIKNPTIQDNLHVLINLINSLKNEDLKLNYIYNLIEKDGILIGHDIYSKKYNRKIDICGHYFYFKKINYATNPNEKIQLLNKMINIYGDNGETEKNVHTCKACGVFLQIAEYDDTEGFSSTGMIKKSREIWSIDEDTIEKMDVLNYDNIIDLDDKTLKELLLNYNLPHDDIDDGMLIGIFLIKNLYPKTGIKLPNISLINTIIDCIQKIKNILPYTIFVTKKIKILQEKGSSKMDIERIEQKGIFKLDYDRYSKITRSSIIISRFLIAIQTNIPELKRTSKTSICSFYSFDGTHGFDYMACILSEMDIVILKDKTKKLEMLKVSIEQEYNDLRNQNSIKKLFKKRSLYDIELSKIKDNYKFKSIIHNEHKNIIIPIQLGNDYEQLLKKYNDIVSIRKFQNILINRLDYLSFNIKKITQNVIESSQLTNIYIGLPESSCCSEDADKFLNYYFYIMTQTDEPIKQNIDESIIIYDYLKNFINIGSIHKFILYDKNMYNGIRNNIIIDDEITTSQNVINSVFEIFVDVGIHSGTLREYVSITNDQLDIKSGLTKTQILSKTYTINEYQTLLRNIEKHNVKYYIKNEIINFDKNKLNKLKKACDEKMDKNINNLVKNIANILNKEKDFIKKYTDLLRNFGIFNSNENILSTKDKIKNRDLMNKKKLDYIKKFYITKLKKYLTIIKNGKDRTLDELNLSFISTELDVLDIQSTIYNHNIKLTPFLNEDIRKYFTDLKLDYTNDEINSINGIDNIYDSKYENIKLYSNFNFNDAANVVLYILINQLNSFILCKHDNSKLDDDYDSKNIYENNLKNDKCKYICNFIMVLFNELESDYELFNLCSSGSESIKHSLEHDYIEYRFKQYIKDDSDYTEKMMKNKLSKSSNPLNYIDNELEIIEEENKNLNEQDKLNGIIEKGKLYFLKKHGYNPTDDQLESFKHNYLKNMYEDEIFETEAYDFDNFAKGPDVIDEGGGYGELSNNDFEADDGFNYSDDNL